MFKKSLLTAGVLFLAAGSLTAGSVSADVTGTWRTQKSSAGAYMLVKIYKCGSKYCGRATAVRGGGDQKFVGTTIIKGMTKSGKKYRGGTIFAPDNGKTYSASMQEKGSRKLKVSGCVAKVVCRSQVWTKQ